MEFKCSPYTALLFFGVLGIFIFCTGNVFAQCKGDFSYESFAAEQKVSGRIEITKANAEPGVYTFKVFRVEADITLVKTGEASSQDKIVIEDLPPGNYLVKIEWGTDCYRTLGGLDGILITRKE